MSANAVFGALVLAFFVCGSVGAARWVALAWSRLRGRRAMARYVDRWPVTRA